MKQEIVQVQENELQAIPAQSESATILQVIQRAAADPSCDIDKMERLMQMHERMQDRSAEGAFNAAMAQMQTEMPSVAERGQIVVNNVVRSAYATFEDINDIAKPIMQKHGFALSFRVSQEGAVIKITGVLMHKAGHREETTMVLPADTSGSKNAVQSIGSSVSYGKRYVMCALLNISTRGEDDDGYAAAPVATVTAVQADTLNNLLNKCLPETRAKVIEMHGDLSLLNKSEFNSVHQNLSRAALRDQKAVDDANNN